MNSIKQKLFLHNKIIDQDYATVIDAKERFLSDKNNMWSLFSNGNEEEIDRIIDTAARIKRTFQNLVIIGAGASNLIPRVILDFVYDYKLNIKFLENADNDACDKILNDLSPEDTCFITISKSGETLEVIALLLKSLEWMERNLKRSAIGPHFYFILGSVQSAAAHIAKSLNATIISHCDTVGRYSLFSATGSFAAALTNLDVKTFLKNGKEAFHNLVQHDSWMIESASYAYSMSKYYPNYVLMSYGDRFKGFNLWLRQLFAESLGKNSKGINPMTAVGTADHHSQLQLYLDGPNDKYFNILLKENCSNTQPITKNLYTNGLNLNHLEGKTLDQIKDSQADLCVDLLKKHNKNVRVLYISQLDEKSISEFCMGVMLEVIILGYSFNINPFNQPSVDNIKIESINSIKKI